MARPFAMVKYGSAAALLSAMAFCLTGCATPRIAPVSNIETIAGAFSLPYRISSSGRFLIDVSINGEAPQPMSVDTGATVSVIYSDFAQAVGLEVSERTLFVRGLVGQGDRPVVENINFQIGTLAFPLDQVVMLETPRIEDEAVGLLGGDILRRYTALFDQEALVATFVPRQNLGRDSFTGWRHIPLMTMRGTDRHLYFAETVFGDQEVPVLIDTGSNLNFINWKLATMDKSIRRLERKLRKDGMLQGALDSTAATVETVFYDLQLGDQSWDEIPVVVTALDGLGSIAPVNAPMMVAGANLFVPHTVAFDLKGLNLYVHPGTNAED